MTTKFEKRKERARELRSTHFELGNDDTSKVETVYVDHYRRWKIDNEEGVGDKLGLKKSHFVLGDDSMKDPYQSLYKRDHVQFDKVAASTLDTETLKDLRRHHFELGTDKGFPKSEAQENFIVRELPKGTKDEFDNVMKRNKAENLHFADDANYFSSVYNEKFNKNLDPNNPLRGANQAEIKKQVAALQASNITLGNEGETYATSMRNAYINKLGTYEKAAPSINLMQTNFQLGDDMQPTESMYKHQHKQFPIEVTKLNDELKSDLRAHHFKFGDKDVNYESTSAGYFKQPGADNYKDKESNPLLYKNHFAFGDTRPSYETSYNATHQQHSNQMPNRANDSLRDRSSNIVLGYSEPEKRSEAQSQFVPYKDAKKAQLDEALSKDLRQSHFRFDGPTHYESYSHGIYKDVLDKAKEINPKGTMKELANDLRRNHFDYGNDPNLYKTSQRDAYKGMGGKSSELEKELKTDLRRNHFDIGNNPGPFWKDTTYRVNYDWKVAEDE